MGNNKSKIIGFRLSILPAIFITSIKSFTAKRTINTPTSQKVNLLFSNIEFGSKLYHHLINSLGYPKKTRICIYSNRHI